MSVFGKNVKRKKRRENKVGGRMSTEPSDKDLQMSKVTAEMVSSIIQSGFFVNRAIPPMPPYPAIPIKHLKETVDRMETLVHQTIMACKQFKKHAEQKKVEVGPLVTALASIDVTEIRIHFSQGG